MFLPLLPDARFIAWRLLMFVPFALWIGFVADRRPTALPYLMLGHALLDSTPPLYTFPGALPGGRAAQASATT